MASADRDVQAQGTGNVDEENPVHPTSTNATSASTPGTFWMVPSSWRLPSQAGKLPAYVNVQFRVKAFGLLAIQSCIMLGIMTGVHYLAPEGRSNFIVLSFGTGLAMMVPLIMLASTEWNYPVNYALLAAVTLLSGTFWGFAGKAFVARVDNFGVGHMHFQMFGCICVTAFAATLLAAVLPRAGFCQRRGAAAAPLLLGWVVGAAVEVACVVYIGAPLVPGLVAALIALALFAVVLHDVGGLLVDCNPDSFMRTVISLNSITLVVISLPLVIVSSCIMVAASRSGPQLSEA